MTLQLFSQPKFNCIDCKNEIKHFCPHDMEPEHQNFYDVNNIHNFDPIFEFRSTKAMSFREYFEYYTHANIHELESIHTAELMRLNLLICRRYHIVFSYSP